ncbi:MAG: ABC transporter ATP-binding protein [Planctomycetota bacterium]|nr:ABC transporter ATP-binding protein [Planctomycetota bacterium]
MTTVAELVDVHRYYKMELPNPDDWVRALDGVSLTFTKGEYAAIVGQSGSGKSTMLNLLGCLDRPTSGQYLLDGRDVSQFDDDALSWERNQRLGFVFQAYNLIPHLTVLENIEVPMEYAGTPANEARDRSHMLAERMGLGARMGHRPAELSGGQQQRVAIARALANEPRVLLADEPTGNLDSATGQEILALMDVLNDEGATLIVVTHDANVAARAHRVIHMLDGRIEKIEENGR